MSAPQRTPARPRARSRSDHDATTSLAHQVAAAVTTMTMILGVRAGLWRVLAEGQALSIAELSHRADCDERHVRAWVGVQVAAGVVTHDPVEDRYGLVAEWAPVLADEDSSERVNEVLELTAALYDRLPSLVHAFGSGEEVTLPGQRARLLDAIDGWVARLCERDRPGWVRVLDGVEERLRAGARVAEIGCGRGAALLELAATYPASSFAGFDTDEAGIAQARDTADRAGLGNRVSFDVVRDGVLPGPGYDLVSCVDTQVEDRNAVLQRVRQLLAPEGVLLLVAAPAPASSAGELWRVLARLASVANAQDGAERAWGDHLTRAGFQRVRVVATRPWATVLEARP